jgi:uncharacterized membrane protein
MAEEFNTNLISVANSFLKALGVPFTKTYLKKHLENNPHYPSLYSMSEVLDKYNIVNSGLKITEQQLDELPIPFLAYCRVNLNGARDLVNVIQVSDKQVTYDYGNKVTMSRESFVRSWYSGIVLLAEKNEHSREAEYENNKKNEAKKAIKKNILLFAFSLYGLKGIYQYVVDNDFNTSCVSILVFMLAGLTLSVLLLIYEIDKSNVFVKNICTGGTKVNCDAVLGSNAAKIVGVSWGEVGFFYFAAFSLFLLAPLVSFQEKIPYLTYTSALAAAYMPFSIYYQYKVVNQWCKLCLLVQAVLLLNFVWAIGLGNFSFTFSYSSLQLYLGVVLLPVLLWYGLKPVLLRAKDKEKYEAAYKRLYTRKDVFELSLSDRELAPDGWDYMGIHKGNPNAENIILKICSPLCTHCFRTYSVFNDIVNNNHNVRLVILYDVDSDGADDERRFPVMHFLALEENGDKKAVQGAMDYWYLNDERNYETLKEKYPVSQELLSAQEGKLAAMRAWSSHAKIAYTPTIYINGKQLPGTYNLNDLKVVFSVS